MYTTNAQENTLDAFQRALTHADGFECDVRLSRDGVPVVLHDNTLLRTHDDHRRVCDCTADALQRLGVPLVSEVVELLRARSSRRKTVVFDLKVAESYCMRTIARLIASHDADVSRVVFLVRNPFRHDASKRAYTVLRAVGTVFRMHTGVDGVACKFDGTASNRRCVREFM